VSVSDISVSGNVVGSAARKGLWKVLTRMGKCTFIFPFLVGEGGLLVLHTCLSVCFSILGDILFLEAA